MANRLNRLKKEEAKARIAARCGGGAMQGIGSGGYTPPSQGVSIGKVP